MNETTHNSKVKLAEAAQDAFGLSALEAIIFAGLEGSLLTEAVMRGLSVPEFFDQIKSITSEEVASAVNQFTSKEGRETYKTLSVSNLLDLLKNADPNKPLFLKPPASALKAGSKATVAEAARNAFGFSEREALIFAELDEGSESPFDLLALEEKVPKKKATLETFSEQFWHY